MGTRRYAAHPLTGTCWLCDEPLGNDDLIRRLAHWVHKTCWMNEKGE